MVRNNEWTTIKIILLNTISTPCPSFSPWTYWTKAWYQCFCFQIRLWMDVQKEASLLELFHFLTIFLDSSFNLISSLIQSFNILFPFLHCKDQFYLILLKRHLTTFYLIAKLNQLSTDALCHPFLKNGWIIYTVFLWKIDFILRPIFTVSQHFKRFKLFQIIKSPPHIMVFIVLHIHLGIWEELV